MPYGLALADTAIEDLGRLLVDIPEQRREPAMVAIEACCVAFGENPDLRPAGNREWPTFPLRFKVEEVVYNWIAAYQVTAGKQEIIVRHVFRAIL